MNDARALLILVHDLYEELELWYPKLRLQEAGFRTMVAGSEANRQYLGKHGYPCSSDISFDKVDPSQFVGLIIPGGFAPDVLRRNGRVLEITQQMHGRKKLIAFICHGGWVPISAKILQGRKVTGYVAIKDDLENAGAIYLDVPVVNDGHLISSRQPLDLPFFCKAILDFLG